MFGLSLTGHLIVLLRNLFLVLAIFGSAHAATEPTLVSAELKTYTGIEDRDHDTGIWVVVSEADGKTPIAVIANALACCGKYGYANHTTNFLPIPLYQSHSPLTKSACQHFKYKIGIMAKGGLLGDHAKVTVKFEGEPIFSGQSGNDVWKFDAWLILHFSDNSTLVSDKLNQTLESHGGRLAWLNLQ